MVQAGASDAGKNLAARTADVVFTAAQTLQEAQDYYCDLKSRMAAFGRNPDDLKILPGVLPIIGRTESEARAKYEALQELIPDEVGVALLASYLSIKDLSQYPLEGPLPEMPQTEGIQSRQQLIIDLGRRENLSIRQLARHFAGSRGHWQLIGTPAQIADELETALPCQGGRRLQCHGCLFPGWASGFYLPSLFRSYAAVASFVRITKGAHCAKISESRYRPMAHEQKEQHATHLH